MKLFILLSFFVSSLGLAQTIPLAPDVKKEIKDCTTYDGTKYKVVSADKECDGTKPAPAKPASVPKPKPVKPKPAPKPCPVCPSCPSPTVIVNTIEKEKVTYKTWRVYGLVGYGQHGLKSTTKTGGEQVDKFYGPLFGGGVDYNVNENWSVGAQGISNESGMLSVGYSFGSGSK